ncbi:MAG TPA: biotin--[acetyl-CoA-carboxylase] ligase [Candidatus Rubrimentiphilum sp.]|nr:biotin--[acetyl-CoA-carboxylase] ligase [Candidatus Rubrimentiphilum sp.]
MSRFSEIRRVESTGSTNQDMAKILGEPHARGLTLVSEYQTDGVGRKGRAWIAPRGSALLFTTALPDPIAAHDLWVVPFWIGLAVHDALADGGIVTQLQWPNDVLLNGAKAAGILCTSRVAGSQAWVACGVGVNVVRPAEPGALAGIDPPPAFLSDVRECDRGELLCAILRRAEASYEMLASPEKIARAWERAAGIPGARYRLRLDGSDEIVEGDAVHLGTAGELMIDSQDTRHVISQADARIMR